MKSSRKGNLSRAKNRAYLLMFLLLILMGVAGHSLANVSGDAEYVAAAGQQSLYQLDIAKSRGTIYDCALRPLTGGSHSWVAAVAPTIEAIGALETATGGKHRDRLALALENGKPFFLALDRPVEHDCIDMFLVADRYGEEQPAPHVVGYLDSQGRGASGIELAMDDALDRSQGQLSVYYQVDALGRAIAGAKRMVADSMKETAGGVVAAIDLDIQQIVEEVSQTLGQGAVVVTEVPNCEIRALASLPDFQPDRIGEAAQRKDSPLVNRAFQAYAPGSVFKLVTAAVELESGQELKSFDCTGSLNAGGMLFQCFDGTAHGQVDLKGAIEKSCNCYFISAARAIGSQPILNMAYNLGLGVEQEFGRGLFTASGTLPQGESLTNFRALANFSFGQGDVTASPLQLCAMMNAIASDGVYRSPKLIAGLVDGEGSLTPHRPVTDVTLQAMSQKTARRLQDCLINAAENGTGARGAPENCVSGIKTGTAQTGRYENSQELSHFWYCGFLSDGSGPRYCITVLKESALESGDTARIFREIGERIAGLKFAPEA
ncbi:penicillin-binding protein 2 [Acutalibacter sp. 1XD8-33]|uniref:penicillin-binding transpeptidase domain-containing protein n=1 Tax=Acutalibacter sp. 1XD8-33 TaxID=2320081 RepID=UPI000EA359EF|nr:penicillin-binding transpeptidase domain-containing protein [Acutalibacter sp. 1XD8-33]RKJ40577.1 penicillin-binding protein 2 [Acutalibacter sp. 1XD8-33]